MHPKMTGRREAFCRLLIKSAKVPGVQDALLIAIPPGQLMQPDEIRETRWVLALLIFKAAMRSRVADVTAMRAVERSLPAFDGIGQISHRTDGAGLPSSKPQRNCPRP